MKKVLIIDDEPLVRRSINRILCREYKILEAIDGVEGLRAWQMHSPDLVFLDVLMPGLTGPQVLKEIQLPIKKQTKIILISAYVGDYDLKELGCDLFMSKPFEDITQFPKIVAEILGK